MPPPGVDGVTWEQYEKGLEDNLQDLHRDCTGERTERNHLAEPTSRKPDGRQGHWESPLEDKIVQRAVTEVLNAIYEVDFLGFSYGFRPGRQAHEALDALAVESVERRSAGSSMRTFEILRRDRPRVAD